jgi:uncharacterized cysteine cluster protein YcgN (CxxCxxCC family)
LVIISYNGRAKMSLAVKIIESELKKPAFGSKCNHCGWCCLTEVCAVGKENGAGEMIPCKFLYLSGGDHLCGLAKTNDAKKIIGIGTGCDAMTQKELIKQANL